MRYFKRHGSKTIKSLPNGKAPESELLVYDDWFEVVVGTDEKIKKSAVTLRSAARAIDTVRSTPDEDYVALEDEDYRLVESIMKEPGGFIPWVNRQAIDWIEDILEAKKVKPGSTVMKDEAEPCDKAKE
jgi:hypothetical protein